MNVDNIFFRKAEHKDRDQIAGVLLDFYNMENAKEALRTFETEANKDFHYLVAIENEKIIGLVTWIMHGLPKHGLFELDRICLLSGSRGKGVGKIPFSFTWTVTSTRTLSIDKQPESKDITTLIAATVGATPVDIPGEDIYPTARDAFTGDDINGAITSGSVVRMDAPDLSAVIAVGDRITTPVTTDGVDTDSGGDDGIVVMDSDVATIMSVGDRVTIGDGSDTALFLDANIVTVGEFVGGEDKQFNMSQPVAIIGGTEMVEDTADEKNDSVSVNKAHLELMVAKADWGGEDMTASNSAISAATSYLA